MAQTPGVTCSSASLPMGTPWEKLLLKASPNLLQFAPPACAAVGAGDFRCSKPSLLQAAPSPPLLLTVPVLQPCVLPSTLQLVHIFPVPGDKSRCSIWMWSGRSHTDRDNPFLDQLVALLLTLPRFFVSSSSHKKKLHQGYKESKPPRQNLHVTLKWTSVPAKIQGKLFFQTGTILLIVLFTNFIWKKEILFGKDMQEGR